MAFVQNRRIVALKHAGQGVELTHLIKRSMVVIAVMLAVPAVVWAQTAEKTLSNGLKVVVRKDDRAPVVVSQIWYRVGSVDEVNGRTGLSHLLEHMMFKGTKTVPSGEFNRRIAAAGGQNNAFTSRDYTVYYEQLAADKLPQTLHLEADRMANLNFSDKDFKNELQVVKEERRWRTDDQPVGILIENVSASAFMADPVRNPVIGWMNDLDNMQPDDLRQWYRTWYAPNNATLVVVGDVDPQTVFREAEKQFGRIPAKVIPKTRPQIEPKQLGIRRIQIKAVSELPYLTMSWKAPRLTKVDEREPYAFSMLAAILDGQPASRLPRLLEREQKIATRVSCLYSAMGRGGALFSVAAIPAAGVSVEQLEKAFRDELGRIARDGVAPIELERVRHQVEASRIYARDSMSSQAMQIGTLESLGYSWRDEDKSNAMFASVTPAEVQAAARSLIDDNLTISVLVPQPPGKGEQVKPIESIGGGDVN